MAKTEGASAGHLRFSLLSLVLLLTTVAAVIAAWMSSQDLSAAIAERDRAESELRQLGYRFGEVLDSDPYGLVVLRHPEKPREAPDTHRWDWTIKLPEGEHADLCFASGAVGRTTRDSSTARVWSLRGSVHLVSLEICHGREHGGSDAEPRWWMALRVNGERFDVGDPIAALLPTVRLHDGKYSAAGQSFRSAAGSGVESTPRDLIRYSVDQKLAKGDPQSALGFHHWVTPKPAVD